MTPAKRPPAVIIETDADGRSVARYPLYVYRFLLSDGALVDVTAVRDDSELRGAVIKTFGADAALAVKGVVRLESETDTWTPLRGLPGGT